MPLPSRPDAPRVAQPAVVAPLTAAVAPTYAEDTISHTQAFEEHPYAKMDMPDYEANFEFQYALPEEIEYLQRTTDTKARERHIERHIIPRLTRTLHKFYFKVTLPTLGLGLGLILTTIIMDWDILRYVIVGAIGILSVPLGLARIRTEYHNNEVTNLHLLQAHLTDPLRYYHEVHAPMMRAEERERQRAQAQSAQ